MPVTPNDSPTPDQWRRVNALLEAALERPPAGRESWLATLDGTDRALEPLLRRLLLEHARDDAPFLRRPVTVSTLEAVEAELAHERAGEQVGPYTLERELGAGGMGTVWLAHRSDGSLRRPVALKLPRYGWARGVGARLQAERDHLASLEHPNIARLYDAGTTAGGRPYIAMEYVDGVPIDEYVTQHSASIEARLELFLQIARAVAHAHARLVVHRDLKPSNILVTNDGQVRLLDFGAAKLLAPGDAGPSDLTREAGRALSPEYAAPEHLRGDAITVAADVYSLGVVLFELLTGRRPYERVPLGDPGERAPRLASRAVPKDRTRSRALRGDLDAILMRALRDDPAQRYATVDAMAEDVRRHLAGEPVAARRGTAWYRASRFVARHRVGVVLASIALASLVGGLAVALWQARIARSEAARAERVTEFVSSIFTHATPKVGVGGTLTAVDLLSDASRRIDTELGDEPAVAARIGAIVGESLDSLGEPEGIEALMATTVRNATVAFGADDSRTLHAELLLARAEAYRDPEAALQRLDRVVPRLRARLPATADDAIEALRQQSFVRARLNRRDPSYAALLEAIDLAEKHKGPLAEESVSLLGLLSNTYGRFAERARQLEVAEEALHRAQRAFDAQRPHVTLSAAERWYAQALRANGRPGEAIPILRRVLADQQKLDGATTLRVRHARFELANALDASGQLEEGLPLLQSAVALEREQNAAETDDRRAFADAVSGALLDSYLVDEAWRELVRAEGVSSRIGNEMPRVAIARQIRRARLLAMLGRSAEAEAAAVAAAAGTTPEQAELAVQAQLARAFDARLQGRPADALARLDELARSTPVDRLPARLAATYWSERASAELDAGAVARASGSIRECGDAFRRAQVEPSLLTAVCDVAAARLALAQSDPRAAIRTLDAVDERFLRSNAASPWRGEVLAWRARAEAAAGLAARAARDRATARELLEPPPVPSLASLRAELR